MGVYESLGPQVGCLSLHDHLPRIAIIFYEKSLRRSVEHAQDLVRLRLDLFAVETHGPIELRVFPGKLPVGVLAEMILPIF